jgi:hypothetical protein
MGLTVIAGASGAPGGAPRRQFRAWILRVLGPPPQPPRRHFSKSMQRRPDPGTALTIERRR